MPRPLAVAVHSSIRSTTVSERPDRTSTSGRPPIAGAGQYVGDASVYPADGLVLDEATRAVRVPTERADVTQTVGAHEEGVVACRVACSERISAPQQVVERRQARSVVDVVVRRATTIERIVVWDRDACGVAEEGVVLDDRPMRAGRAELLQDPVVDAVDVDRQQSHGRLRPRNESTISTTLSSCHERGERAHLRSPVQARSSEVVLQARVLIDDQAAPESMFSKEPGVRLGICLDPDLDERASARCRSAGSGTR